jgi:hypothetical protein
MSANEKAEVFLIIIKRISKWIFFAFLAGLLIFLSLYFYDKIHNYIEKLPKVILELKGIKVGEKYSDFVFKNPDFKEKTIIKYKTLGEMHYEHEERRLSVSVLNNKIDNVVYICENDTDITSINGISCYESGDIIIERFADELRIQCHINKTDIMYPSVRVYDVVKYGVRYYVMNNRVLSISISTPDSLLSYKGINWGQCE